MELIPTKRRVLELLEHAIEEQNLYLDEPVELVGDETKLYCDGGNLDSLSLITIIADIERAIKDEFDVRLRLANEHDLSLSGSQFSTLGKMAELILDKIGAERKIAS